jgi:hypothetical protein
VSLEERRPIGEKEEMFVNRRVYWRRFNWGEELSVVFGTQARERGGAIPSNGPQLDVWTCLGAKSQCGSDDVAVHGEQLKRCRILDRVGANRLPRA